MRRDLCILVAVALSTGTLPAQQPDSARSRPDSARAATDTTGRPRGGGFFGRVRAAAGKVTGAVTPPRSGPTFDELQKSGQGTRNPDATDGMVRIQMNYQRVGAMGGDRRWMDSVIRVGTRGTMDLRVITEPERFALADRLLDALVMGGQPARRIVEMQDGLSAATQQGRGEEYLRSRTTDSLAARTFDLDSLPASADATARRAEQQRLAADPRLADLAEALEALGGDWMIQAWAPETAGGSATATALAEAITRGLARHGYRQRLPVTAQVGPRARIVIARRP